MFHALIIHSEAQSSQNILYDGKAKSVLLPGSEGEFEVLDLHKPVISRLKKGYIVVDNDKDIRVRGGVVKMSNQKLVAIVEL